MYSKVIVPDAVSRKAKFNPDTEADFIQRLRNEPMRGPHAAREIDLLTNYHKPAAIMNEIHVLPGFRATYYDRFMAYIYHRIGDEHLMRMIIRAKDMFDRGHISPDTYHIRLGRLFGYSKESIRYFIEYKHFKQGKWAKAA